VESLASEARSNSARRRFLFTNRRGGQRLALAFASDAPGFDSRAFDDVSGTYATRDHNSNRQLIFGSQGNESQKGIIVPGLFVFQDPTARHEEASNDNTILRLSGRPFSS
jgi:hypothetical protein